MGTIDGVGIGTGPTGGVGVGVTLGDGAGDGDGLGLGEGVGVWVTTTAILFSAAPPLAKTPNAAPAITVKRTIDKQKRPALFRSSDINFISFLPGSFLQVLFI